jgi:hypothetical protein
MTNFERWCEMAVDAQNTPHVIGEMRKPEGIDSFDSEAGTSVKSPEPYLLLDQMTIGSGKNLDRPTGSESYVW